MEEGSVTKEVHPQKFNFSRLMAFDRLGISFNFVDPSNLIFLRLRSGCNKNGETDQSDMTL